ncbi:sugar phosphate isomerase/epimerase family protein [Flagellimonas algicola]|uniref:TIM barrel protein n=1 Tax=Flagellimonas algicola TaxID=2583815 RepID=A0ABY2WM58_9FLAO|nr:TIM barrel protein [Allomuricauda algicola]TMU56088.1 TIM barrel protein [Allomuricauda algicola]
MKETKKAITRRNFTKISAAAIGSMPLMGFGNPLFNAVSKPKTDLNISLFSKHLQFLDYNEMAAAAAEMGFNGLDLTVRPKGNVLPENVTNDLSKAVDAMKKYGVNPEMMTTNVWDVNNPEQKTVLETASELGFTHYRTGWLKYPENRTIEESQILYGQQAKKMGLLNKELGLIGCYQNHAGNHVGAPIWDLPPILEATNNQHFGAQYDIRHAVVEGGGSWELGLRQIKPFIKSIVIKDFKWGKVDGKWKPVNTPLGEGMVDFNRYFSLLKKYNINVPVSLHLEYDLGGAEHGLSNITIDKKEVFDHMKKDLNFLRNTWSNAK